MKKWFIFLLTLLIIPSILAVNLQIEKLNSEEVMILDLGNSAVFDLKIKNNGPTDDFQIYTFFGSGYSPKEFTLKENEVKTIQFIISPPYDDSRKGTIVFDYFIRGSDNSEYSDELVAKVINLNEAFEVGSADINPESDSVEIYLRNRVNYDFKNINTKFSSIFFNFEESFSLSPKETKKILVKLNQDEIKKFTAGFYTLNADVDYKDKEANIQGTMRFTEKNLVITEIEDYGFLIRTKIITKSNGGNLPEAVRVDMQKNVISRLFTSFSPQPDDIRRQGSRIYYAWNQELPPGEILKVKVKTNWFLPLITIMLIVAIVTFVKEYSKSNLRLRKKITFVKSKGGEFALKVSLIVHARKQIDNVMVIERVPPLVSMHKNFGKEQPKRIDEKNKKAEWHFQRLEAGEKRLITYIIYSKVGVMGKFALPRATGIYERDGKIHETQSNSVFFVTEQIKERME